MFPEERKNTGPEPEMVREAKEKKIKQPKPPKVKHPKVKQPKPPKIKESKPPKVKKPKVKKPKKQALLERRNARPLAVYLETLTEPEQLRVDSFFAEIETRVGLDKHQTLELVEDFERAILYYVGKGLPLETALKRLDPVNLGGFYARPPLLWFPLDDAAKVYPLYMRQGWMAVFRLSVYLRQPVVPELLQMALTFTVKRFPSFATTVKNGFFWHYMDSTKRRYVAEPETDIPCRPLKVGASGSQTFRVLWYQRRISVEFFHILTDANGGMVFLKTLTAEYLRLLGVECASGCCGVLDINEAPRHEELENAFERAELTGRGSGFVEGPAVQMSGTLSSARPCRVLHLEMDSGPLLEAARSRGVTVTAFILSRMMVANRFATEENKGNIQIQVPVDMRKLHDTATLRNFALYGNVKLPIELIGEPDDILPEVARQLSEKTSAASMNEMMTATRNLVRYLRFVPLFIKRTAAKLICGYLGDAVYSNTLSNLGAVRLPPELEPYVEKFDFVLGTVSINRAACSMVTCGGTAVLCIAKLTSDPSFEERLTALLRSDKLDVRVKGSELYEY